jgi:cysteinyl-tRNA synthetase
VPESAAIPAAILSALADDLNTPLALAGLHELVRDLNVSLRAGAPATSAELAGGLLAAGSVLGLLHQAPHTWLQGGEGAADASAIEDLIARRLAAKRARNFAEADRIRDELAGRGIVLEDKPGGKTEWRRAG